MRTWNSLRCCFFALECLSLFSLVKSRRTLTRGAPGDGQMEDGDPERDDAEPIGDVEETPRGTDGDAADDADARPGITTNEATEALLAILWRYALVQDRLPRGMLLRDLEAAERMTETEAREYVEGDRFEFLRHRYAEAGLRERAPLGRVVGADEMSEASPVDDASRVAARDALRAYRALPTLHSYLGEVGDRGGGGPPPTSTSSASRAETSTARYRRSRERCASRCWRCTTTCCFREIHFLC